MLSRRIFFVNFRYFFSIFIYLQTDNRTTILNFFRPALVNSPLLSNTQCLNLVSFWLDCHSKVLKVPLSVQRHAKDKIDAAEMGLENQTTGEMSATGLGTFQTCW